MTKLDDWRLFPNDWPIEKKPSRFKFKKWWTLLVALVIKTIHG